MRALLLLPMLCLVSCGQSGDLYLPPPKPAPAPVETPPEAPVDEKEKK